MEHQVRAWSLPPAPAKDTDSRTAARDGPGQVGRGAAEPRQLERMCREATGSLFDPGAREAKLAEQREERREYVRIMKEFAQELNEDDEAGDE